MSKQTLKEQFLEKAGQKAINLINKGEQLTASYVLLIANELIKFKRDDLSDLYALNVTSTTHTFRKERVRHDYEISAVSSAGSHIHGIAEELNII